jgi:predicted acetyltransferase
MEDITDEIPKVGDYSVILNSKDEAVCVIRDYDVYIRPFGDVPPFHAYAEGEGNMSLEYWRNVHTSFFKECLDETDMPFNQESKIICEKFSVEYIPGENLPDEELLFVEPSMNFEKEIAAYRQEMLDADSSFDGCFSMKRMPNIKEYVDHCIEWANPRREADERGAWGNVLLAIRKSDMKMVGCMQVHNVLTERMKNYTGHVGYSVRPSERRKGYAKRMLAKAVDFLSSFGFEEIVVSCLSENEASKKTILSNGGEYIETVFLDEHIVSLQIHKIQI